MSSLTKLRNSVITHIKNAKISEFVTALSGDIDLKLIPTNAIYIKILKAENIGQDLDLFLSVNLLAIIVSRQKKSREVREQEILEQAEILAKFIHGSTFNFNQAAPAKLSDFSPLNDEGLEANGISIWIVAWQQNLEI